MSNNNNNNINNTEAKMEVKDNENNNTNTDMEITIFEGQHTKEITAIIYEPKTKTVITGSADGSIRQWDVEKKTQVEHFEGHPSLTVNKLYYDILAKCKWCCTINQETQSTIKLFQPRGMQP